MVPASAISLAKREEIERKHRPHMFEDCSQCGEPQVKIKDHVCDPVRKETYWASLQPVYQPNLAMVEHLRKALLGVFLSHRVVVTDEILNDLALAVEPLTGGPRG